MKVSSKRKLGFEPVELIFTLESQVEVDKFYALVNYLTISRFLDEKDGLTIFNQVRDALNGYTLDAHGVQYNKLCEKLRK